jgi:phage terminase small subunit
MIELKLTEQERKWAESYVEHLNATRACREAGYEGNDNALRQKGKRLVTNRHIQEYIASIIEGKREEENNRIATMAEVMEFYSKGMRGEIKDQFGLDAMMSDRIKCAQSLDKILQLKEKAKADETKDEALTVEQYYGRDDNDGE